MPAKAHYHVIRYHVMVPQAVAVRELHISPPRCFGENKMPWDALALYSRSTCAVLDVCKCSTGKLRRTGAMLLF